LCLHYFHIKILNDFEKRFGNRHIVRLPEIILLAQVPFIVFPGSFTIIHCVLSVLFLQLRFALGHDTILDVFLRKEIYEL